MRPNRLQRSWSALTPPEVWLKLQRLQARVRHLGDQELDELLAWIGGLLAVQRYIRHDPTCEHLLRPGPGSTRCTCGLARLRQRAGRPFGAKAAAVSGEPNTEPGRQTRHPRRGRRRH